MFAPESQADAYDWLVVLVSHAGLGLVLTAIVAAIADRLDGTGWGAWAFVSAAYATAWEGVWQGLGAGIPDAAVDSASVSLGGLVGLFLWRRDGIMVAGAVMSLAAMALIGVEMRW